MPFHPVGLLFKSAICIEVTLFGLYQKTKFTRNKQVLDKMDRMDSNRRRTIDVNPVQSVADFVYVQKFLTNLPNVNGHGTNTPNVKRIENRH